MVGVEPQVIASSMIYQLDVVRASNFCSDPPPTGQFVVVEPHNLALPDGTFLRVFKLERAPGRDSTWSVAHFERFPFFNPIGLSEDPSTQHDNYGGYLLRTLDNFDMSSASKFASYFSAVECLLIPAR